jgi:Tfp pilus assembly protein PilW
MNTKGMTMVETIVYVAIFSVISMFVFDLLHQTSTLYAQLKQNREMNETGVFIMEKLTRDIKSSVNIDSSASTFGANPGRLSMNTITASGTPTTVEYRVIGDALYLFENGVGRGAIMASTTRLDGLIFNFMQAGQVQGVKIDLHLRPAGATTVDSQHYYSTVLLRGSY